MHLKPYVKESDVIQYADVLLEHARHVNHTGVLTVALYRMRSVAVQVRVVADMDLRAILQREEALKKLTELRLQHVDWNVALLPPAYPGVCIPTLYSSQLYVLFIDLDGKAVPDPCLWLVEKYNLIV